jgi:ankyrin repeat protein
MMCRREELMSRFMLLVGMGTALIAAGGCQEKPGTPLAAAAARNDVEELRRLLTAGHVADDPDDALTPLIWAARAGAIEAMTTLLDAGADVDARGRSTSQWTPLQHAIHRGETGAARLLLERGADPNASSSPGSLTPLLMAAADPDPTVVKLLLTYGADPRIGGEYGETPLTQAVSGGALRDIDRPLLGGCRAATVRALLERDPGLSIPDNYAGRSALWWARFHGCEDVLRMVGVKQASAAHQAVTSIGRLRHAPRERRGEAITTPDPTPKDGR